MSVAKIDIWMPIYIGDYLRDTQALTAEEHGVYFLLLMHYWQKKGEIGSDIKRLAIVARSDQETTRNILDTFFVLDSGSYKNKRADEELRAAKSRSDAARENVQKRWNKDSNTGVIPPYNDGNTAGDTESIPTEYSSSPHSSLPIPIQPSSEKKEGSSRIEKLKKYWNESKAGPECRLLSVQFRPEDASDCLRTMSVYTDDEIIEAITIYGELSKNPECDTPRYGGFVGFMRGGVEKFVASANPAEAFKIRKKFESAGEREERERAESLARLEAMP